MSKMDNGPAPAGTDASRPRNETDLMVVHCLHRAAVLGNGGDLDSAVAECTRALELDPGNPDALRIRSALRTQQGRGDDAMLDIDRALQSEPGRSDAHILRAMGNLRDGRSDAAVTDASRALSLASDDSSASMAHLGLAMVRMASGDYDAALRECDLVPDVPPGNVRVHMTRALILSAMGERGRATAELQRYEALGGVIPVLASTPQWILDYLASKQHTGLSLRASTPAQDQPQENRKQRRGERRGGNRR